MSLERGIAGESAPDREQAGAQQARNAGAGVASRVLAASPGERGLGRLGAAQRASTLRSLQSSVGNRQVQLLVARTPFRHGHHHGHHGSHGQRAGPAGSADAVAAPAAPAPPDATHAPPAAASPPPAPPPGAPATPEETVAITVAGRRYTGSPEAILRAARKRARVLDNQAAAAMEAQVDYEARIHDWAASVSDTLGGATMPPVTAWAPARRLCAQAQAELARHDWEAAGATLTRAITSYEQARWAWNTYVGDSSAGAARAITTLEVVEVAGAIAATVATGGIAGAALGTASTGAIVGGAAIVGGVSGTYGAIQSEVRQGSEIHAGLRRQFDWAAIMRRGATDAVTNFVAAASGGILSARFARVFSTYLADASPQALAMIGRSLGLPGPASRTFFMTQGQRFVADFVGNVGSAPLATAAHTALDRLTRNGRAPTLDAFMHAVARDMMQAGALQLFVGAVTHMGLPSGTGPRAQTTGLNEPGARPALTPQAPTVETPAAGAGPPVPAAGGATGGGSPSDPGAPSTVPASGPPTVPTSAPPTIPDRPSQRPTLPDLPGDRPTTEIPAPAAEQPPPATEQQQPAQAEGEADRPTDVGAPPGMRGEAPDRAFLDLVELQAEMLLRDEPLIAELVAAGPGISPAQARRILARFGEAHGYTIVEVPTPYVQDRTSAGNYASIHVDPPNPVAGRRYLVIEQGVMTEPQSLRREVLHEIVNVLLGDRVVLVEGAGGQTVNQPESSRPAFFNQLIDLFLIDRPAYERIAHPEAAREAGERPTAPGRRR